MSTEANPKVTKDCSWEKEIPEKESRKPNTQLIFPFSVVSINEDLINSYSDVTARNPFYFLVTNSTFYKQAYLIFFKRHLKDENVIIFTPSSHFYLL